MVKPIKIVVAGVFCDHCGKRCGTVMYDKNFKGHENGDYCDECMQKAKICNRCSKIMFEPENVWHCNIDDKWYCHECANVELANAVNRYRKAYGEEAARRELV